MVGSSPASTASSFAGSASARLSLASSPPIYSASDFTRTTSASGVSKYPSDPTQSREFLFLLSRTSLGIHRRQIEIRGIFLPGDGACELQSFLLSRFFFG